MPALALACRPDAATLRPVYQRLRAAAISAARRNNAALYFSEDPVLGPELISPTPTFNSRVNCTSDVVGGRTRITATTAGAVTAIVTGSYPSKQYSASARVPVNSANVGVQVWCRGFSLTSHNTNSTADRYGAANSSNSTELIAVLFTAVAPGDYVEIDNLSIREILNADTFGYQDAAGTLPGYLGGPMGLWLDKSYGLERGGETLLDMSSSAGWTLGASMSIGSGVLNFTNSTAEFATYPYSFVAGKAYVIECDVVVASGTNFRLPYDGAVGNIRTTTTSGHHKYVFVSSGNTSIYVGYATSFSGSVDNISVRELKGVHLTQATAGAKPTGARVPKKLGPELVTNGTFDSGTTGWGNANACTVSAVGGKLRTTQSGTGVQNVQARTEPAITGLTVGKTYWLSGEASALGGAGAFTEVPNLRIRNSADTADIATSTSAASTGGIITAAFVATETSFRIRTRFQTNASADATTYVDWDNISVREVLEWSPVLSCDGGDSLAAPSSIIGSNLSQPYTMIASGVVGALGATRAMVGDQARVMGIDAAGLFELANRGGGTGLKGRTAVQGENFVLASTFDASSAKLYLNGAQAATASNPVAPTAVAGATIVGQTGLGTYYWNSNLDLQCIAPAVMPDADRKAIERFAAFRLNVAYAG